MSISSKLALRVILSTKSLGLMFACLCVIICSVLLMNFERPRAATRGDVDRSNEASNNASAGEKASAPVKSSSTSQTSTPTPLSAHSVIPNSDPSTNIKDLVLPVSGVTANQLRDSFYDSRSEGRMHGALDIMAPKDTPVLAADDGTVLRLNQSERGGVMLYQSDPTGSYVLYYGHLSRYAEGVAEGNKLRRGEVIAYVGDTGNAGTGNFHLHFGISRMTSPGKWYGGEPINPYPLLKGAGDQATAGK
jgi:peptidoglycan LD-endopeptidase LytH